MTPAATLEQLRQLVALGPPYDPALLESLRSDPRAGARALYETCLRANHLAASEQDRLNIMMRYETEVRANGFARIAGVDEAGRGPLAGPIVAAAVVLDEPVPGLDDSKRLTPAQRDALFDILRAGRHAIGVASVSAQVIDLHGIQSANYAAMAQAAAALDPPPDFLLVDGFAIRGCPFPQKPIVKGDRLSASIAAASIIAKVTRDRIMDDLDHQFPGYGFVQHKGYATAQHLQALERLGSCPAHRKTFAPIATSATSGELFG